MGGAICEGAMLGNKRGSHFARLPFASTPLEIFALFGIVRLSDELNGSLRRLPNDRAQLVAAQISRVVRKLVGSRHVKKQRRL